MASSLGSRASSTELDSTVANSVEPPTRRTRRLSLPFWRLHHIQSPASRITHMDIFVGSLTGTAQRLAVALVAKAQQRGVVVSLESLDHFDATHFRDATPTRITVFVVATHFAGGPSPNAESFAKWLRSATGVDSYPMAGVDVPNAGSHQEPKPAATGTRSRKNQVSPWTSKSVAPRRHSSPHTGLLHTNWWHPFSGSSGGSGTSNSSYTSHGKPKNPYLGTQYAVFGVGNSEYLTYNAMGKFVDARLKVLGAERLCPLGLGDVSADLDDTFAKWEAKLLALLPVRVAGLTIKSALSTEIDEEADAKPTRRHSVDCGPSLAALGCTHLRKQGRATPRRYSGVFDLIRKRRNTLPSRPPGVKCTATAIVPVPMNAPAAFVVQDRYGRSVRLHYCCRYVSQQEPTVDSDNDNDNDTDANANNSSAATGRLSSFRVLRDATHVRRFTIAIKSLAMLTGGPVGCDNAIEQSEVALARMELRDPGMSFETADTLGYFPPNTPEMVAAVGQRLGLNLDACVEFVAPRDTTADGTGRRLPFPSRCTVRTVLSDFLELRTVSREFVRVASGFVTDQQEHKLLQNLVAIDCSADFTREFAHTSCGVLKLLELAPSLRVTFEVLVNIAPLIKPRLYSIASSHLHNPREFDIVVSLGNPQESTHGLSVSYFRRLLARSDAKSSLASNAGGPTHVNASAASWMPPLSLVRGFVSSSLFKPPSKLSAPMVLIAQNVGIAPLRALLQHRSLECGKEATEGDKTVCGKSLLLLGWSAPASVLFRSELREWEAQGLVEIHTRFASESNRCMQELVSACKSQIAALMRDSSDAQLHVCGAAAMVRSVQQVLMTQQTDDTMGDWFARAMESGRYLQRVIG